MKAMRVLHVLADLTASQWGMATTAQAARLGIGRLELSRLAATGHLERLGQGVYRAAGVPSDPREGIKSIWLSIDPRRTADERLRDRPYDAVVSGPAASWLLGIGDLVPEPYEFTTPTRRHTKRSELTFRTRSLPNTSVTIRDGLPVTTYEQTIADLVESHIDHSLISDVIADVPSLDRQRLASLLAPLADRNGYSPGDGQGFLADLDHSPRKRHHVN